MLLLVVESPGTYAELGAFSYAEHLRPKLLPILDRTYRHEDSFLASGPIKWLFRFWCG